MTVASSITSKKPQAVIGLDNLRLLASVWQDKTLYDLTKVLISASWSEKATEASQTLSVTLLNTPDMPRITAPGNWLALQIHDEGVTTNRLEAYVWSRTINDASQGTITLDALDVVSFLQRQGTRDWLFRKDKSIGKPKGWTAQEIVQYVAREYDVTVKMPSTFARIPYLSLKRHTPYEVLIKALTRDRHFSGRRWRIRADGRQIVIHQLTIQKEMWEIAEGQNLLGVDWTEGAEGKKTDVTVRTLNRQTGEETRIVRAYSPDIRRYGRLQEVLDYNYTMTPKQMEALAAQRLKRVGAMASNIRLKCIGIPYLRASDAVFVNDSGTLLNHRFFIDEVTHNIEPTGYTCDVTLGRVLHLPAAQLSREELDKNFKPKAVTGLPPGAEGAFINPLGREKYSIISNVAGHKSRAFGNWESDCAVDMSAPTGTPVLACFQGTVTKVNTSKQALHSGKVFGATITLASQDNLMSAFYTHIDSVKVRVNDKVQVGQEIAAITRWDGGPSHLHFALRDGAPNAALPKDPNNPRTVACTIDPEEWLRNITNQDDLPLPTRVPPTDPGTGGTMLGLPEVAAAVKAGKITFTHSNDNSGALGSGVVIRSDNSPITVDTRVWQSMAWLVASGFTFTVSSMLGTHSQFVADSNPPRQSRHWTGLAYDIAIINGISVTNSACRQNTINLMRILVSGPIPNQIICEGNGRRDETGVGMYEYTNGKPAPNFYKNGDHEDHVHVGF